MTLRQASEDPNLSKLLKNIAKLCKAEDVSLTHEDAYGAFTISKYSKENEDWLLEAYVDDDVQLDKRKPVAEEATNE